MIHHCHECQGKDNLKNYLVENMLGLDESDIEYSAYFLRRFQVPFSFLRHPPLTQLAPPLLKTLFPLPSFLFHPLLRYFRQFPPTFLHLRKYQKVDFTNSTVAFYQKSTFDILNPFTNRLP